MRFTNQVAVLVMSLGLLLATRVGAEQTPATVLPEPNSLIVAGQPLTITIDSGRTGESLQLNASVHTSVWNEELSRYGLMRVRGVSPLQLPLQLPEHITGMIALHLDVRGENKREVLTSYRLALRVIPSINKAPLSLQLEAAEDEGQWSRHGFEYRPTAITVVGRFPDGSKRLLQQDTDQLRFEMANTAIAVIDKTGNITPKQAGITFATVRYAGLEQYRLIEVFDLARQSIPPQESLQEVAITLTPAEWNKFDNCWQQQLTLQNRGDRPLAGLRFLVLDGLPGDSLANSATTKTRIVLPRGTEAIDLYELEHRAWHHSLLQPGESRTVTLTFAPQFHAAPSFKPRLFRGSHI